MVIVKNLKYLNRSTARNKLKNNKKILKKTIQLVINKKSLML